MRKLVTIRTVAALNPIENADAIECAVVDGWEVVVKKGEVSVGEKVVFFEIDCLLPASDPRFAFLYKGKDLIRLRTIKLRGQVSQGLVLPLRLFPELPVDSEDGLEELLGITKYEIPDSSNVRGCSPASTFPHFIPKTDEERIQNIYNKWQSKYAEVEFVRSVKLDGSSITIATTGEERFRIEKLEEENYPFSCETHQTLVASRNQTLRYDETSHFWKGAKLLVLKSEQIWKEEGKQYALQGELVGPGIQGNREGLTEYKVLLFRIYDIVERKFLDHEDFIDVCSTYKMDMVPQLETVKPFQYSLKELLEMSRGKNIIGKNIEGIVYKSVNKVDGETLHFKVINNDYLLEKDK